MDTTTTQPPIDVRVSIHNQTPQNFHTPLQHPAKSSCMTISGPFFHIPLLNSRFNLLCCMLPLVRGLNACSLNLPYGTPEFYCGLVIKFTCQLLTLSLNCTITTLVHFKPRNEQALGCTEPYVVMSQAAYHLEVPAVYVDAISAFTKKMYFMFTEFDVLIYSTQVVNQQLPHFDIVIQRALLLTASSMLHERTCSSLCTPNPKGNACCSSAVHAASQAAYTNSSTQQTPPQ